MSASIQAIGERAEILNDLDLLALISLFNEARYESREQFISLQPFFDTWHEICVGYGPGTIDLDLEGISSNEKATSELEQLFNIIENKLKDFGQTIPATAITTWCDAPGVTFIDYSTTKIKTTIARIRALMKSVT